MIPVTREMWQKISNILPNIAERSPEEKNIHILSEIGPIGHSAMLSNMIFPNPYPGSTEQEDTAVYMEMK